MPSGPTNAFDPVAYKPGVLPHADVLVAVYPDGEYEVLQPAPSVGQPGNQVISGLLD